MSGAKLIAVCEQRVEIVQKLQENFLASKPCLKLTLPFLRSLGLLPRVCDSVTMARDLQMAFGIVTQKAADEAVLGKAFDPPQDFTDNQKALLVKEFNRFARIQNGKHIAGLFRVSSILYALGMCLPKDEIERVFWKVDENEDETLDFDEFLEVLKVFATETHLKRGWDLTRLSYAFFGWEQFKFYRAHE
jgi:hypothetical protein